MRIRDLLQPRWGALLLALVLLGVYSRDIRVWMLDDAFISFRYAENFARGDGLVYNVGERVEGYTTFLWVLVLGICHWLGFDLVASSRWLGMALTAGCLVLVALCDRFVRGADGAVAAVAVLLLGSCATFTTWGVSGMEVPLVALLLLLGVLFYLRAESEPGSVALTASGTLSVLAAMARPDAGLLFAVLLADRLWQRLRHGRGGWLRFALPFAVLYLPYFAWRFAYYGWLLPNTFYAKVGSSSAQLVRGLDYFTRWSGVSLLLVSLVVAGVLAGGPLARRYGRVQVIPAFLGVYVLYVVAVGGDGMPAFRFFGPVTPLVCVFAAMALVAMAPGRAKLVAVTSLAVALNLWQLVHHVEMRSRVLGDNVARRGEVAGRWLRQHADPHAVIATNTAGTIPFYSGLRTIDMLGMNDSHIAHREIPDLGAGVPGHEKGDGAYVLSRRPDYILFDSAVGSRQPRQPSDREIFRTPEFARDYKFHVFRLPGGQALNIYVRKSDAEAPAGR